MNEDQTMDRLDRTRELLMRALDDELTLEEQRELDLLLADDPGLRAERERLGRLREVTADMKLRNPPEELWDGYWNSAYSRVERGIGWILVSFSVIVVGGWATQVPPAVAQPPGGVCSLRVFQRAMPARDSCLPT